MKKKVLALVCALTMVMGMSISVFAASPQAGSISTGTQTFGAATVENFANVTTVEGATVKAVDFATASEAVAEANALFGSSTFVATIVDITGTPGTITIKNPNVWAGQSVIVLHKVNGVWKQETVTSVADNAVTLTVDSFSPFAVVIDTSASTALSPKTRDIVLMVGAIALVCVAGVVLTGKKKEA